MADTLDLDALKARYGAPVAPALDLDALKARYGAPTPSDLTLDIVKDSPDTAPAPEGAFARYSGQPDLPLEESVNPLELGISGYGAKVGLGAARYVWPTAGRLVQLGAQGLGLEVGHKVNQATGQTPGSITDFGWPDVANFVIPYAQEGVVQTGKAVLRAGRAGQAVQVANDATAAQDAAYATQAAADRGRLAADGSLQPVAPPPTPVVPTLKESGADTYRRLGELGTGVLGAVYSGHPVKSVAIGLGVAAGDKGYDAFSRWLLSQTPSPLLLGHAPLEVFRQAIGPSGALDHRTMAVLYGVFTSGQAPESPAGP